MTSNRHGRFRDSDLLRRLFENVLGRCIDEGLVGGEAFAVEGRLIRASGARLKSDREGARPRIPPTLLARANEVIE